MTDASRLLTARRGVIIAGELYRYVASPQLLILFWLYFDSFSTRSLHRYAHEYAQVHPCQAPEQSYAEPFASDDEAAYKSG
jgi:hypothetical protein